MARGELTDAQWKRLEPLLPPLDDPHKRGRRFTDHRRMINGMLWIDRTSAPWRDLPERYGPWQSCYDRFRGWCKDGTWTRLMQALQRQADSGKLPGQEVVWEGCAVDSTTIKAHPHAAGMGRIVRPGAQKKRRQRLHGRIVVASAWAVAEGESPPSST